MTVEDKFPVGMRVLAVDDDPTCLSILGSLLRKCQYHVSTTNQAVTALNMLREGRNQYDLVISDVNMPDMDGFKLLELVGLEMDVPVIMLSAHSDKELVYKGVTHGAVDYLLKPVRMEELKNIWQHVVRRKEQTQKNQKKDVEDGRERDGVRVGESRTSVPCISSTSLTGKSNKKRRDQDEEDGEKMGRENTHENEELGIQKKPRVAWTAERHRKFVAAVKQLGFNKAVPKKILDLMNDGTLTRENVASHLQKYRQYLKKYENLPQEQDIGGAVVSKNASYLNFGSMDRTWSRAMPSHANGSFLGCVNSTVANQSINTAGRGEPSLFPLKYPDKNVFVRFPSSPLDSNSFLWNNPAADPREVAYNIDHRSSFTPQTSFAGTSRVDADNNMVNNVGFGFGNQSLLSSPFWDQNTGTENWNDAMQSSKFLQNSLAWGLPYSQIPLCDSRGSVMSAFRPQNLNNSLDFSSSSVLAPSLENSEARRGLIGNVIANTTSYESNKRWEEDREKDHNSNSNDPFAVANPIMFSGNGALGQPCENLDQGKQLVAPPTGQGHPNGGGPSIFLQVDAKKLDLDPKTRPFSNGFGGWPE